MMSGGGDRENYGVVGAVALSGVVIFNGLDATQKDAVENEYLTMDNCLSHAAPGGDLHYHSWSPCIHKSTSSVASTS